MDHMSLAEIVLFSLEEESGIIPEDGLLERVENSSPQARRRLGRLDTEVFTTCAVTPLELSSVLADLALNATGDDGRIDTDKAWAAVVATRDNASQTEPADAASRILDALHHTLGLESPCQQCADWQPEDAHDHDDDVADADGEVSEDDGEEDVDEEVSPSLLERVFTVHAEALDDWAPQVAFRVAANAGVSLAEVGGFEALHGALVDRRRLEGVSPDERAELHMLFHVGTSLCMDAAHAHALALSHKQLAAPESVAAAIGQAERVTSEESGVLAAVVASVLVDRVAPAVQECLDSAPPEGPPRRPARTRRRGGR